jgi:hypothetical protein
VRIEACFSREMGTMANYLVVMEMVTMGLKAMVNRFH